LALEIKETLSISKRGGALSDLNIDSIDYRRRGGMRLEGILDISIS
jgi:hypothetical protein